MLNLPGMSTWNFQKKTTSMGCVESYSNHYMGQETRHRIGRQHMVNFESYNFDEIIDGYNFLSVLYAYLEHI